MVKSTKSGQKPTKNRLLSHFSTQTSGSTKKVEKTALKSVLSIVNYIDLQSPKTADKIDKMIKESYKKYPEGTEQRALSEELSLTGIPKDMLEQLNLSNIPNINVYNLPEEQFSIFVRENNIPESIAAVFLRRPFFSHPDKRINIGEIYIKLPAIILKGSMPFSFVHEATHWSDLHDAPFILPPRSPLEYTLDDNELSAYFNGIIYFLYAKNNAKFHMFIINLLGQEMPSLETIRTKINPALIFLWDYVKESFHKNGLQKTIKMKKEIIEKVKEKIIEAYVQFFIYAQLKNRNISPNNIEQLQNKLESMLGSLPDEIKTKIRNSFYDFAKNKKIKDWMPKRTREELYNFYGERFLRN